MLVVNDAGPSRHSVKEYRLAVSACVCVCVCMCKDMIDKRKLLGGREESWLMTEQGTRLTTLGNWGPTDE